MESDRIRCDVTGKMFRPSQIRQCRHAAVVRKYGTGGIVNVSVFVCNKCPHAIRYKWHGGLGCELERSVSQGT